MVGTQCNDMHAQHGQRPQELRRNVAYNYGSVKNNDQAALNPHLLFILIAQALNLHINQVVHGSYTPVFTYRW